MRFNLSESYPTAFDDSSGVKRISDGVPQQSLEGIQHELELPSKAIFPYCSLIFSFKWGKPSEIMETIRKWK